ncbi:hypothetical protein FB45DRAFT_839733, partial [Roridomyces roridus]
MEYWKASFNASGLVIAINCRECADGIAKHKRDARQPRSTTPVDTDDESDKENPKKTTRGNGGANFDASIFLGLSPLTPDDLSEFLSTQDNVSNVSVILDTSHSSTDTAGKARADEVSGLMWDATDYRFSYHSVRRYKGAGGYSRFSYHCAQASTRKLAPEKIDNLGKRRDKGQMKTYNCNGWLNIWAASDNAHVYVQLKDHLCHETYTCIDIPADVKEIVKNNPDMRVSDLWKTKILPLHPKPNFKRKSIYNLHLKEHQARWRIAEDELESAIKLIQRYTRHPDLPLEQISMPEHPDDGCTVVAFALPSLIDKWRGIIREIGLDSTFKTNRSGYECYAVLGEVHGSGVPLGFLFLKSKNPEVNAKEDYIRRCLRHFVVTHKLDVDQCVTDKDITEINAMLAEIPAGVKYQVCFWHAIRIVKGRLCVLARRPAPYDGNAAFRCFDWIDRTFAFYKERLQVAQSAIPRLNIYFNGKTMAAPARPKLVINLNGKGRSPVTSNGDLDTLMDTLDDELEGVDIDLGDIDDRDAIDRFDGPDSWFEPGETVFAEDKKYIFCPAAHRSQILHMFIRHFCEHPLL